MEDKKKDLFICYSSKDKDFVSKLANDLKSYGVKVWWDQWEMKVGDSIIKKIQDGISKSSWLAIVLSPNSVKSAWVEKEINTAQIIELEKQNVFILPVLYKNTEIPIFLKDKVCADFRVSYKEGFSNLINRFVPSISPEIINGLMSENNTKILRFNLKIPIEEKEKYYNFVINKLYGETVREKRAAMMALFVTNYKNLPPHLMMMLNDLSISVRRQAIFYLGELRYKKAIDIISGLISDGNPDIRATARDAYKKITGRNITTF